MRYWTDSLNEMFDKVKGVKVTIKYLTLNIVAIYTDLWIDKN